LLGGGITYVCQQCDEDTILQSKECTEESLPNTLHKLGDIYYKECPPYSREVEGSNECNCENMYYEETIHGQKKKTCLTSACPDNKKFYDYGSNECYGTDCKVSTHIKKYEKNGNIRCHSSCLPGEFYKKLSDNSEICIDSCDRYIFYDSSTNKKYCKDDCKKEDNFRKKNNYCYDKEECDFYDSDYCLNSCEESAGKFKHNFNSKECISNCVTPYIFMKNNICYNTNICNYFKEVDEIKLCISTCNVGEGYIAPDSGCYSSCSLYNTGSHEYFNHGENVCIEKCSASGNSKIYRKQNGIECFSSCKEIEDGTLIFEKNDASGDVICYSYSDFNSNCLNNDNNYYITKGDGVRKCVESSYCSSHHYNYLKGKECLGECTNYIGIDNPASTFINCFEDFNECNSKGYKYYNINEKKCWKELPTGYCKISNSEPSEVVPFGGNNNYYYNDGQCVTSCKGANKYIDFYNKKNAHQIAKKMITQIFFMSP
jgi:hypothetical protein